MMRSVSQKPVEVGQVYRDKDKRMRGRHLKVTYLFDSRRALLWPCTADGSLLSTGARRAEIAMRTLQTRFELIGVTP